MKRSSSWKWRVQRPIRSPTRCTWKSPTSILKERRSYRYMTSWTVTSWFPVWFMRESYASPTVIRSSTSVTRCWLSALRQIRRPSWLLSVRSSTSTLSNKISLWYQSVSLSLIQRLMVRPWLRCTSPAYMVWTSPVWPAMVWISLHLPHFPCR